MVDFGFLTALDLGLGLGLGGLDLGLGLDNLILKGRMFGKSGIIDQICSCACRYELNLGNPQL